MTEPILRAVVDRLRSMGVLEGATLEHVTIGDAAVMVELAGVEATDGIDAGVESGDRRAAGLAHRPSEGAGSSGGLEGATDEVDGADGIDDLADGIDVETLVQWAVRPPSGSSTAGADSGGGDGPTLETAVGVAAINALSAPFVDWESGDPMALLDPSVDVVATVGLFRPAFRKFSSVDVRVIERRDVGDVSAPDGVTVTTFGPDTADVAMADADVVFITGSAFVYGGLERYLEAAPAAATVVLIGATASVLPEPAFAAGVDVLAGASVTDPARVRDAIEDGACGTDLHDAGLRKVYAVADGDAEPGRGLEHLTTDGTDSTTNGTDSTTNGTDSTTDRTDSRTDGTDPRIDGRDSRTDRPDRSDEGGDRTGTNQ